MASDTYSFGAVSNGRGEEGDARAEERPTVKRSGYSRHKCTFFVYQCALEKMCTFFPMGEQVGIRVNTVLDPKSRTIYVRRY